MAVRFFLFIIHQNRRFIITCTIRQIKGGHYMTNNNNRNNGCGCFGNCGIFGWNLFNCNRNNGCNCRNNNDNDNNGEVGGATDNVTMPCCCFCKNFEPCRKRRHHHHHDCCECECNCGNVGGVSDDECDCGCKKHKHTCCCDCCDCD